MKRLVVFISGSGSNLQAILDATAAGRLDAEVVLVVSNRKDAYGLTRAENAGVPTLYFPFKPYREAGQSREAYDAVLADRVSQYQPDLVVLAGWMHVLSPAFLDRFPKRVINLHPALPGTFIGVGGIEWAFEAYQRGELEHGGCMVHYVIPEVDAGPVIVQKPVPILPDDTLDTYAERVHAAEHRIMIEAIQKACEGLEKQ
jgi:formyltetrahydrofolate-dependent phosphoribosylglycinamide formyltransferase